MVDIIFKQSPRHRFRYKRVSNHLSLTGITSFNPDQVASTAHTLTSTRPSGRRVCPIKAGFSCGPRTQLFSLWMWTRPSRRRIKTTRPSTPWKKPTNKGGTSFTCPWKVRAHRSFARRAVGFSTRRHCRRALFWAGVTIQVMRRRPKRDAESSSRLKAGLLVPSVSW